MKKPDIIYLGADHAGFEMKNSIKHHLEVQGYQVEDLGAHTFDAEDDYPEFAQAVSQAVQNNPKSLGILSCGNAGGITIAANKFKGIRAGIGYSKEAARTMRTDDDANIISIPGRLEVVDDPLDIVDTFINTDFSQAERHNRRLNQVSKLER